MPTTRVYIDGFNLYYGLIRANRAHWLDLKAFAERLNFSQQVDRIIYCTAMVQSTPDDPDKAQRQDIYHRALRVACPNVEILKGNFSRQRKWATISGCTAVPTCVTRVAVRTEKGSDVNLAARLLHDAHTGKFDRAIVVSGDSDLVEPIRIVTQELKKIVWVRNPRDRHSAELDGVATSCTRIRPSVLSRTQLPDPVTDGTKTYQKPAEWKTAPPVRTRHQILNQACPQAGCAKALETFHWR